GRAVLSRAPRLRRPLRLADAPAASRRPGAGARPVQVQPGGGACPASRHHCRRGYTAAVKEFPMSAPARLLLIAAAVAATLAACNRDREEPAAAAPAAGAAVTPADAAAPLSYEAKTPFAEVDLTLPEALKPQRDLHARVYAEEVRKLRQFVEGAQGERTEAGFDTAMPAYEKKIAYSLGGETGRLFSLKRTDFDWSGGAHPNTLTTGLLWD